MLARRAAGCSWQGSHPYVAMQPRWRTVARVTALLARLLYADLKTYLHELLMKQDQMSMAASHREPRALPGSSAH